LYTIQKRKEKHLKLQSLIIRTVPENKKGWQYEEFVVVVEEAAFYKFVIKRETKLGQE